MAAPVRIPWWARSSWIGKGWLWAVARTSTAGGPHAEILALRDAGTLARGATLYCTLEPCSHVGRTGPCAPAVADAAIARVVVAATDPNPLVNGRGIELLRSCGVEVTTGVLAEEATTLNLPFVTVMTRRRPFVTMKAAVSADHRIAERAGQRTPLTGPAANRLIHRDRAEVDAIAVGSGTILSDDPVLTARGAFRGRPLARVVFDTRLRTAPAAKLFSTLEAGPVIIVTTRASVEAHSQQADLLSRAGAEILTVAPERRLPDALEQLASRGISSLIVEGGVGAPPRVLGRRAGRPRPDVCSPTPAGTAGRRLAAVAARGAWPHDHSHLGADMLTEAYVHGADRSGR